MSRVHCLLSYISLITTTTMIDHLIGRPSPSWKRAQVSFTIFLFITISILASQVFLVIIFWVWRIVGGNPEPPKILWLTKFNRVLREISLISHCVYIPNRGATGRFTPWQIVLSTLTGVYALKNLDKILGLSGMLTNITLNPSLRHYHSAGAFSSLSSCFVLSHTLTLLLMLSRIVFAILLSRDLDSNRSGCRVCYRHVHPEEMVTGSGICNILCVLYRVRP